MPRYSQQDEDDFAKSHAHLKVRPDVPFSVLWDNTVSSTLVVLEEADYALWTWGRLVCVGDRAHKMMPAGCAGEPSR